MRDGFKTRVSEGFPAQQVGAAVLPRSALGKLRYIGDGNASLEEAFMATKRRQLACWTLTCSFLLLSSAERPILGAPSGAVPSSPRTLAPPPTFLRYFQELEMAVGMALCMRPLRPLEPAPPEPD